MIKKRVPIALQPSSPRRIIFVDSFIEDVSDLFPKGRHAPCCIPEVKNAKGRLNLQRVSRSGGCLQHRGYKRIARFSEEEAGFDTEYLNENKF